MYLRIKKFRFQLWCWHDPRELLPLTVVSCGEQRSFNVSKDIFQLRDFMSPWNMQIDCVTAIYIYKIIPWWYRQLTSSHAYCKCNAKIVKVYGPYAQVIMTKSKPLLLQLRTASSISINLHVFYWSQGRPRVRVLRPYSSRLFRSHPGMFAVLTPAPQHYPHTQMLSPFT